MGFELDAGRNRSERKMSILRRKHARNLTRGFTLSLWARCFRSDCFHARSLRISCESYHRASSESPAKSIAVLPFDNATRNADTEYLSDGISEALINSLSELQQLKIIARSTAFRYKGKQIDPQSVGRDLKVQTVLMGVVRQLGDRLNVQVDLVDAVTGSQLWGQEYERKLVDVLAVKQALVREVTEKLRLEANR